MDFDTGEQFEKYIMDSKKRGFLTRLEQLEFSLSKCRGMSDAPPPPSQADANRNLYLHLAEAEGYHCTDYSEYAREADGYAETYAGIVDNMDDSGLNNFAAGALSLSQYHKNESSKWKSSLSNDSILNLPVFKERNKAAKLNKAEDEMFFFEIPLRSRKSVFNVSDSFQASSASLQILQPDVDHQRSKSSLTHTDMPRKNNATLYSSVIKRSDNLGWEKQSPPNPLLSCEKLSKRSTALSGNSFGERVSTANNVNAKESFTVSTSNVGGPYANFGQKRKVQNNWRSAKESAKFEDEEDDNERPTPFKTAREQFIINQQKKHGNSRDNQVQGSNYGSVKRSLGTRRGPANKFVPPVLGQESDENGSPGPRSDVRRDQSGLGSNNGMEEPVDERLKGIDPNMIELIKNDIMDQGSQITWSDIAGLEFAKKTIQEIVVWPMLRPDIFTGLRGPPKGLLLFGPPGTGKTLIGKCIASQSKSTFFCISASSLTSKWVGEGEKMVRALFAVARCSQPAVVFIDEVDSLLSQRSDSEHESSRRIKTEFLVQLDGASTASDERLLVIGATNRPQEIDEAARRRFVKRLLIPLPEKIARRHIIVNLMSQQRSNLSDTDLESICDKTGGYSGADMSNLCREAALGPIRSIPFEQMETITPDQVRSILLEDFEHALFQVRASVSSKDLELYVDWNKTYGSFGQ